MLKFWKHLTNFCSSFNLCSVFWEAFKIESLHGKSKQTFDDVKLSEWNWSNDDENSLKKACDKTWSMEGELTFKASLAIISSSNDSETRQW